MDLINIDILCVGAGATGLYLADKVNKLYKKKRMVIVDIKKDIGGKINHLPFEDKLGIYLESDELVHNIIREKKIETEKISHKDRVYYHIKDGFMTLFECIFQTAKFNIPFYLNTRVYEIKTCPDSDMFIVDNRWKVKKIVFTGTLKELSYIYTDNTALVNARRIMIDYIGEPKFILHTYLKILNPWWKENDIGTTYKIKNIGSIYYYNRNMLYIKSKQKRARILYRFIPSEFHSEFGKWNDSKKFGLLNKYLKNNIPNAKNNIFSILFYYNKSHNLDFETFINSKHSYLLEELAIKHDILFLPSTKSINSDWDYIEKYFHDFVSL